MARKDLPAGPYCYALMDGEQTFYVGKGRGARMFHHAAAAQRGKPGAKCERIREILAQGRSVEYRILGEYESDAEAFKAEKAWVASFSGLLNQTAGGGGAAPDDCGERDRLRSFLSALALRRRVMPFQDWLKRRGLTAEEGGVYWQIVRAMDSQIDFMGRQLRGETEGPWVL